MLQDGENYMFTTNLCNEDWFCWTWVLSEQYAVESAALSKYLDSQNTIRFRITINLILYVDIALL